jgi:hypothetical protein
MREKGCSEGSGPLAGFIVSGVIAAVAVLFCLASAAPATAADRVYWADYGGDGLFAANLDAPWAGQFTLTDPGIVDLAKPAGVALDPAAGRIYWANWMPSPGGSISWANLDGSGGGQVDTGAATLNFPTGLAVDPGAGRLYWANFASSPDGRISWADLDGSGAGDLNTTGATVNQPAGVAIDPVGNSIYWTNYHNSISRANLDNTGGGADISTTGASLVSRASGIVLHKPSGRLYWTSGSGSLISFANADGSGSGGDMSISGATVEGGHGLAIDSPTGRIFWVNGSGTDAIAFAALSDGAGGILDTLGLGDGEPSFMAILRSPAGAGPPSVTGGNRVGAKLTCSQASWAGNRLHEHFYRAPADFSFRWLRGGKEVPGETGKAINATRPGSYRCEVTASNYAGSASQTSSARKIKATPRPTVRIVAGPKGRVAANRANFRFRASRPSVFQCQLTGRGVGKALGSWRRCGQKGFRATARLSYRGLRPGPKTLRVRVRDRSGMVSRVAVRSWRVTR